MGRQKFDRTEILRLFEKDQLSGYAIAKRLGAARQTINHILQEHLGSCRRGTFLPREPETDEELATVSERNKKACADLLRMLHLAGYIYGQGEMKNPAETPGHFYARALQPFSYCGSPAASCANF